MTSSAIPRVELDSAVKSIATDEIERQLHLYVAANPGSLPSSPDRAAQRT
jgi:hypothetical protein